MYQSQSTAAKAEQQVLNEGHWRGWGANVIMQFGKCSGLSIFHHRMSLMNSVSLLPCASVSESFA